MMKKINLDGLRRSAKAKRDVVQKASRPRRKKAKPQATAIVPVAPTQPLPVMVKRHGLTDAEVTLLKNTIAKGTTDDEFALFLWVAKKHKLDPMTRQLHCVKRWSKALNDYVMAIQIGIDGYRSMGARSHKDFGGVDEPEFEYQDCLTCKEPVTTKSGICPKCKKPAPLLLARVRVWKKGFDRPTIGIAFWNEYHPDLAKPESFMWIKMPKGQLAKCAEALALRKGYPDLADIYTDEEMAQADDDYSPSGRQITVGGEAPSVSRAMQSPEFQAQFAPPTGAQGNANRQPGAPNAAQQDAAAPNPLPGKGKKVQLIWPSEASEVGYVTGDIAPILPFLEKECFGVWLEVRKVWAIPAENAHVLQEYCQDQGYQFTEVSGPPSPAGKQPDSKQAASTAGKSAVAPAAAAAKPESAASGSLPTQGAVASTTATAPAAAKPVKESKSETSIIKGTIEKVNMGMVEKNTPTREVKISGKWHKCFSQTLHEFLDGKHGKVIGVEVEVYVQGSYKNIVGFKRIGSREFDTDGKTPIVHLRAERPKEGDLFA